jgi:stage V sporulation protein AE
VDRHAAGAALVARGEEGLCRLTYGTPGRIVDYQIKDANHMGAAMAPAVADTMTAHFEDTGRGPEAYDHIVTGDLGSIGRQLLMDLMAERGMPLFADRLSDCGASLYAPEQDAHAGQRLRLHRVGAGGPFPPDALRPLPENSGAGLRRDAQPRHHPAGGEHSFNILRGRAGGDVMDTFWLFVRVFLVGGALCAVGEVLILKTKLTSARILVLYVVAGAILTALGLYKPLVDFAAAGATVPLTGFGYSLAMGAIEAVREAGLIGALTGGLTSTAAGIATAILFGIINALLFKPAAKP